MWPIDLSAMTTRLVLPRTPEYLAAWKTVLEAIDGRPRQEIARILRSAGLCYGVDLQPQPLAPEPPRLRPKILVRPLPAPAAKAAPKRRYRCSACRKEGHMYRHCPKLKALQRELREAERT